MLTRCIAFATESAEDRYEMMTSTSAFADRDEERNANPAGWPATEAPVASERRRWPRPHNQSLARGLCEGLVQVHPSLVLFNSSLEC